MSWKRELWIFERQDLWHKIRVTIEKGYNLISIKNIILLILLQLEEIDSSPVHLSHRKRILKYFICTFANNTKSSSTFLILWCLTLFSIQMDCSITAQNFCSISSCIRNKNSNHILILWLTKVNHQFYWVKWVLNGDANTVYHSYSSMSLWGRI